MKKAPTPGAFFKESDPRTSGPPAPLYFTAASSAAVHGVVREAVAARTFATLAAVIGVPLFPHVPRT